MTAEHFRILGTLLFISGSLLLLGGCLTWLRAHRKYSTWKSADGVVTHVVSRFISASNFHFYPVVEFRTETGKIVSFESELGFYPARHTQGQRVSVYYNEADPGHAMLDLMAAKWTLPFVQFIFGVIMFIIGGIILALV
jgi:hypothetical protein